MKIDNFYKKGCWLDGIIEAVYLMTIIIVPLYFSVIFPTFNVFELGKTVVLRVIILLFLGLTVVKIIFFPDIWRSFLLKIKSLFFRDKYYYFIPLIFIIGLGVIVLCSENINQSFFGSYDRQAGYLSYLYYFGFFLLLSFNLISPLGGQIEDFQTSLVRKTKRFLKAVVITGSVVSVYAILQIFGIDFLTWPEDPLLTGRAFSSLGQANFLASWLLLAIPVSSYLIFSYSGLLKRFPFVLAAAVQITALFLTASRGGVIAFFLLVIILLAVFLFKKISTRRRLLFGVGASLIIAISIVGVSFLMPGRWQGISDFSRGSLAARFNFYQAAADGFLLKPILGYGLDNIDRVFIERYEKDWGIHSNIGVKNDRAHNIFLDWLLFGGLLGLGLIVAIYYYAFQLCRINVNRNPGGPSLAFGAGLLGYSLSLLVSFSFVSGELYFFSFLAWLLVERLAYSEAAVCDNPGDQISTTRDNRNTWLIVSAFLSLFLILILIAQEIRHYRADNYFQKSYYHLLQGDYRLAALFLDEASKQAIDDISRKKYQLVWAEFFSENYNKITDDSLRADGDLWLKNAQQYISGKSFEEIFVRGKIAAALGDFKTAEDSFREVSLLSPYWPKSYIELARVFVRLNRFQEALVYYQLALEILPSENDDRFNDDHRRVLQVYRKMIFQERGDLYLSLGDYEMAEQDYQAAYASELSDFSVLEKIATTYYLRQDLDKALEYIIRGADRSPNDYRWLAKTTILLKEKNNLDEARLYLGRALELAPDAEILLQLKNELY